MSTGWEYDFKQVWYAERHAVCGFGRAPGRVSRHVIKISREEVPDASSRVQREFSLAKLVDGAVLRPVELVSEPGRILAVYEDFGGRPLTFTLSGAYREPFLFLSIAFQMARALEAVHKEAPVLGFLVPHLFFVNSQSLEVRLMCPAPRRNGAAHEDRIQEGFLQYLAPEQTGKLDRAVDARADLYALGAIFYEMAAGRSMAPVGGQDEILHFHLARDPKPLAEAASHLPGAFQRIIEKLISKDPAERYPSVRALRIDLERCLQASRMGEGLDAFHPGTALGGGFHPPSRLYGRTAELRETRRLRREAVQGAGRAVFISGRAGVGKTAFIRRLAVPEDGENAFFAYGKISAARGGGPYDAVAAAVTSLVRQALALEPGRLDSIRQSFSSPIGQTAKAVVEIAPQARALVGDGMNDLALSAEDSRSRMHLALGAFFSAFAAPDRPLFLILDDIQWADRPLLDWIRHFLATSLPEHCLFAACFRDEECPEGHPVRELVDSDSLESTHLYLENLSQDALAALAGDCLGLDPAEAARAARAIYAHTRGNAFYSMEWLRRWDEAPERASSIPPSTSPGTGEGPDPSAREQKSIFEKLDRLPPETRQAVASAAVCGSPFDVGLLARLLSVDYGAVVDRLAPAVRQHVLVPDSAGSSPRWTFVHDCVHQQALRLLDEETARSQSVRLGFLLADDAEKGDTGASLLSAAGHLARGRKAVTREKERLRAARICLDAGMQARRQAAFANAQTYLEAGLDFLGSWGWEASHELMMALHMHGAEAANLNARPGRCEELLESALKHSRNVLEEARIQEIRFQAFLASGRLVEAVKEGLKALKSLGVGLPANPSRLRVGLGLKAMASELSRLSLDDLMDAREMEEGSCRIAMPLLLSVGMAAYAVRPNLTSITIFRGLRLTLDKGVAPESAACLGAIAFIISGLGDIAEGRRLGEMARRLQERWPEHRSRGYTECVLSCFVDPWTRKLSLAAQGLAQAFRRGVATASHEWAANCLFVRGYQLMDSGAPLDLVDRETARAEETLRKIGQERILGYLQTSHHLIRRLQDRPAPKDAPINKAFQDPEKERELVERKDVIALYTFYYGKVYESFFLGDYEEALRFTGELNRYRDGVFGSTAVVIAHMMEALSLLSLAHEKNACQRWRSVRRVRRLLKDLQNWADHAPANHLHRYELVRAELAGLSGDLENAPDLYAKAILDAKQNGFLQDEALACELAGRFMITAGDVSDGKLLLAQARLLYLLWGAEIKVRQMDKKFGILFHPIAEAEPAGEAVPGPAPASRPPLFTVREDALALETAEAALEQANPTQGALRILAMAAQSLGARSGGLLLDEGGIFRARALARNGLFEEAGDPLESCGGICPAVVQYVVRTREPLRFSRDREPSFLLQDAYLREKRPGSVLCVPVLEGDACLGTLYLENRKIRDLFNDDSVKTASAFARLAVRLVRAAGD